MKRFFVITMLACFLSLCCLGSAEVKAAPPPPGSSIPTKEQPPWLIPNIAGSWQGKGKIFSTLQQETVPYTVDVTINITEQSGGLFIGTMLVQYDTAPIPGSNIKAIDINIGGNISKDGELAISGAAVFYKAIPIPLTQDPLTAFIKVEVTASLVSGKFRRLTGNWRFTAQLNPEEPPFFGMTQFLGHCFPGTFNVDQQPLEN